MARPEVLQRLQHGKVLTQSNFPDFVETFNYSVNRIENIKGDKEVDFVNGHITVDDTDPEHPVLRWNYSESDLSSRGIVVDAVSISCVQISAISSSQTLSDLGSGKIYEMHGFHEDPAFEVNLTTMQNLDFVVRQGKTAEDPGVVAYCNLSGFFNTLCTDIDTISATVNTLSGGGHCSCDVSAYYNSGDKLATWTNGSKIVDIYMDSADIVWIYGRLAMTPFFYNETLHKIVNNVFYCGREWASLADLAITQGGYYYLKITNNTYPTANSYTIVRSPSSPENMSNTETDTYYALWRIGDDLKALFDYRQCFKLPFYSA